MHLLKPNPLALCLLLLSGFNAQAAGLFFYPKGLRSLTMGGSYMVYVDDVHALHYNPATLLQVPWSVQLDATYAPIHTSTYQRTTLQAGGPAPEPLAKVQGSSLHLPVPSLLLGGRLPWWPKGAVALGVYGESSLLQRWPSARQLPYTPQRYTSSDVQGTWLLTAPLAVAFSPWSWLQVGGGVGLLFGQFAAEHTLSACDGLICTLPENPDYDTYVQVVAPQVSAWSGYGGILVQPWPFLAVGIAYSTGYRLQLPATFRATLPSAAMYRSARLSPDPILGQLRMELPSSWRVGVGGRWREHEWQLAWHWQAWSVHRAIDVDVTQGEVQGIVALPSYRIAGLSLPRNFRDTWSLHLGYKTPCWQFGAEQAWALQGRFGAMVEPSAISPQWLSTATVDLDKGLLSAGASLQWRNYSLDTLLAVVGMVPRQIKTSQILQPSLLRPPWSGRTLVAQGHYSSWALLLGFGVVYRFDPL